MPGIVIVGAGEAGVRAAFTLREKGYDGPVTLLSEECALPYERPPLSKSVAPPCPIMPQDAYESARITLCLDEPVRSIDPAGKRIELGYRSLPYDKLLLTTGAEARRLPELPDALYLRRDTDAAEILSRISDGCRLVILGAGFIGLELAATARARGADVTVVEQAGRILGRAVLSGLAQELHARHESEGVRLVTGLASRPHDGGLVLENGEKIPADLVVVGIGAVPRTDLAAAAELEIDNGIVVDHAFRCSVPDIYAAGDCCAVRGDNGTMRFESWRVARDQAERAAAVMLGEPPMPHPVPYFWSDQFDLCLQVIGLPDLSRPILTRSGQNGASLHFQLNDAGQITSVSGLGIGTSLSKDIKLAGRLIERGCCPDPAKLCDPLVSLKKL